MSVRLANAGHGEYLPDESLYRVLYDPGEHETRDLDGHTLGVIVAALNAGASDEQIRNLIEDLDEDVQWYTVIAVDEDNLTAAFMSLLEAVDNEPHGDDDVYDYWPSGVRLARQLAPDDEHRTALELRIREFFCDGGIAATLEELGL